MNRFYVNPFRDGLSNWVWLYYHRKWGSPCNVTSYGRWWSINLRRFFHFVFTFPPFPSLSHISRHVLIIRGEKDVSQLQQHEQATLDNKTLGINGKRMSHDTDHTVSYSKEGWVFWPVRGSASYNKHRESMKKKKYTKPYRHSVRKRETERKWKDFEEAHYASWRLHTFIMWEYVNEMAFTRPGSRNQMWMKKTVDGHRNSV